MLTVGLRPSGWCSTKPTLSSKTSGSKTCKKCRLWKTKASFSTDRCQCWSWEMEQDWFKRGPSTTLSHTSMDLPPIRRTRGIRESKFSSHSKETSKSIWWNCSLTKRMLTKSWTKFVKFTSQNGWNLSMRTWTFKTKFSWLGMTWQSTTLRSEASSWIRLWTLTVHTKPNGMRPWRSTAPYKLGSISPTLKRKWKITWTKGLSLKWAFDLTY